MLCKTFFVNCFGSEAYSLTVSFMTMQLCKYLCLITKMYARKTKMYARKTKMYTRKTKMYARKAKMYARKAKNVC